MLLLPSDTALNNEELQVVPVSSSQTNDADALHEINNVGVPTYEGMYDDRVELIDRNQSIEYQLPPDNYLRRTHSFDVSDIYAANVEHEIDYSMIRHRRSEPDLSKYGLFAEVTMECTPMQPPPLVLNNPFYDGSYALDPSHINPGMVVLPENYLAFEDSFVPAWDYKPEYLIDQEINPDLYYDGVPLIPTNDPWSVYCNDNAAFEYYSPHFQAPLGEDGIHYTPLTDLDYAIPQYMSLPVVEQTKNENYVGSQYKPEDINPNSVNETGDKNNNKSNIQTLDGPVSTVKVSNVVSEDEKVSAIDSSTNRESSTRSEESFNADISNNVTSSLAFIPSSKSSQRPDEADDTSDDTSPCSTDYHEASALDLVQSLDELSCYDSTDFSQSRDDIFTSDSELPKLSNAVTVIENQNIVNAAVITTTTASNLPLNQLPSIPLNERPPTELPPVTNIVSEKDPADETVSVEKNKNNETHKMVTEIDSAKPSETLTSSTNLQNPDPCVSDTIDSNKLNNDTVVLTTKSVIPPAVPPSWLAPRPPVSGNLSTVVYPPQIRVQNAEDLVNDLAKSLKVTSQPSLKVQQATVTVAVEEQPSCSFTPSHPAQNAQLKPEKQSKEVEVSQQIITVLKLMLNQYYTFCYM